MAFGFVLSLGIVADATASAADETHDERELTLTETEPAPTVDESVSEDSVDSPVVEVEVDTETDAPEDPAPSPTPEIIEEPSDEPVDEPADELDTIDVEDSEPELLAMDVLAMPTGRNYLAWEVKDASGNHVGGATISVEGPRALGNTWGSEYFVTDCTVDPCHPNSMDQDPRPGHFAVPQLTRTSGANSSATHNVSSANRYRIRPIGSINGYQWTSTSAWKEIPGSGSSPSGWPANGPWKFADLTVAPRAAQPNFCQAEPATAYYSLQRDARSPNVTTIRRVTHNAAETAINGATVLIPNSTATLGNNQTANSLGVTPTGVFYFAGQQDNGRQVTTYRFDPQIDSAPYPVWTMDLLSESAGYVVAGDATVYNGREEFYYAYYSSSPVSIGGRSALRMHLYRYSAGDGTRTGEVGHVDVARPANFTTSANAMNGDFAFDGANNLQFIMSDTNGGYTVSGSVAAEDLHHLPGAHTLPAVPTIRSQAIGGQLPTGFREAINGVAYTQSGRAIVQQGGLNVFADPTTMTLFGSRTTLSGGGAFVDLASCAVPTTITVQKNLEGDRFKPEDQFVLNASRTAGTVVANFESVTTTGSNSGIQDEKIGPFAMIFDGTFSATESITSNAENYDTTWACYLGDAGQPFVDGTGRTLEFALQNGAYPGLLPGSNITCTFTNRTLRPQLAVEKSSAPVSGSTVTEGDDVTYTLTFDNSDGSAPAAVDHVDHLRDVLDDADFVSSTGAVVNTPAITTPGSPPLSAQWDAAAEQIAISGSVPAGEVRTVSFAVRVKPNAENANNREAASDPLAGYWLRNYVTPAGENPPATCEEPADGAPALCTEHPIPAWTVKKDSVPADDSLIAMGDTVHYRVTVSKLNNGAGDWALDGVVITDDLTDVMKMAGWTTDADPPAGTQQTGIYLYDSMTGSTPTAAVCVEPGAGDCVPTPQITAGTGQAPYFGSAWTMTTRAFDMPADIVRAEVWYSVTIGEPPTIAGEWEPEDIQWGSTITNSATGDSTTQPPQQCITGVDESFNDTECEVTQRLQTGFFTIEKEGVSADGIERGLSGHAFEIRDDASGVMGDAVSAQMCTMQDWHDAGYPSAVPDVPWQVDPDMHPGSPADCAYLYPVDSDAQQGTWRSQNLPAGDYWLVETQAPTGYQLLAQPVRFTVADAEGEGKLTMYDANGNPAEACGTSSSACVDATGWLMVIQDPKLITLPVTGGHNINALISAAALALISTTFAAAWLARRRGQY